MSTMRYRYEFKIGLINLVYKSQDYVMGYTCNKFVCSYDL